MSYEEEDTCRSYEEEDTCMSHEEEDTCRSYQEEDTCMSYEEEDTCMSYEEEDTCMSYEEEDTCIAGASVDSRTLFESTSTVSKETYYSVKRDLLQHQKRPVREILQRDGSGVGAVERRGADVRYEPELRDSIVD
jgi:hypothetical protein